MGTYTGPDGLMHNNSLPYPTMDEVNRAIRIDLARWVRFLPSPGLGSIGKNLTEFHMALDSEKSILNRVYDRFENEFGGWDSVLSKTVGWSLQPK